MFSVSPRAAAAATTSTALFFLLSACSPQASAPTETSSNPAPAAAAPGGQKAGAGTPCAEYETKICDAAGAGSELCSGAKKLTAVMPAGACTAGLADIEATKTRIAALPKPCADLVSKLCADLGAETQTCKMVTARTAQFGDAQCSTMLESYPKVIADLRKMEEANKPLTAAKQQALVAGDPASFGPTDAKVTVVEFSDFECPYCSGAAKVVTEIKAKYADRVRFVFRQFPLPFHKKAHLAHQAALAAKAQGKFWPYHDRLFANQKALDRSDLDALAKELGLNMKKFGAALDAGTYKAAVDQDIALGQASAVNGTPTMFVNGARVQNPTDFKIVAASIDAALAGK